MQSIEGKGTTLNKYWVPSHTNTDHEKLARAPSCLRPWHVAGNKEAYNLAGIANKSMLYYPK